MKLSVMIKIFYIIKKFKSPKLYAGLTGLTVGGGGERMSYRSVWVLILLVTYVYCSYTAAMWMALYSPS